LQEALRKLGYPCGLVDGIFGGQLYRAVVLFQSDHDCEGEPGVWRPEYDNALATAQPMLPGRQDASHKDLAAQGDKPVQRLNLLQRCLAWLFGASAVAQVADADSVIGALSGFQGIVQPAMGVLSWVASNRWLLIAGAALALIALVRYMRARHVDAYRSFTYQGDAQ
jgi:peptidoglycan hydrolase-like protein with peptidoglycan-binding domain